MTSTPPNPGPTVPAIKETPLKTNRTHDHDYRFGGLRKARVAVLEELGSVPVVDLAWFLSHLLPENKLNIDDVLEKLVSSGARGEEHWETFPRNPGTSDLVEDRVFQGFGGIVEAIVNAIAKTSFPPSPPNGRPISRTSHYLSQPNKAPISIRDNKSRPDGFFKLGDIDAEADWLSIIGPAEFKKSTGDTATTDNITKIIWSMHHIMREDARRRFTFGITIEDTWVRFWFASRSVILASEPFSFMMEPEPLIQMVNFLTYASEEQLGYDTTMHRIPNSRGQFIIDINKRKFQTTELLADFSADSLLGRGTRVWSGFFQDCPEKEAVLKDCWAERDRRLEGNILTTLRNKYCELPENAAKDKFDDYFLTMIAHETIPEHDTQIMMKMTGNQLLPANDERLNLTDHITESDRQQQSRLHSRVVSSGLGPSPEEVMRVVHRDIKWRCHYRISFNEVAKPLYDVTKLRKHMRALRDAMIGIGILRRLGYVHRDISSGNILFYRGKGKLSDLEYCKPFNSDEGGHDVRTGTRHFMSVEVAAGLRLFTPSKITTFLHGGGGGDNVNDGDGDDNDDDDDDGNDDDDDAAAAIAAIATAAAAADDDDGHGNGAYKMPPFQFFILHDVESVWWLLTFALFANGIQGEPSNTARENRQKKNTYDMFPMSLNSAIRRDAFTSREQFPAMKDNLPSALHPIFNIAEALRRRLTEEYERAELTEVLNQSKVSDTLSYFRRELGTVIKLSGTITLIAGLKFNHKRPAEEVGEDGGEESTRSRKMPRNI